MTLRKFTGDGVIEGDDIVSYFRCQSAVALWSHGLEGKACTRPEKLSSSADLVM